MIVKDDKDPVGLEEGAKAFKFGDVVKFEVKYPKDYGVVKDADGKIIRTKPRYMKDGDIIDLHRVQADNWVERGLGKIVK